MATKTTLKSGNFRVQIRKKGFKLISRTFAKGSEADSYKLQIKAQIQQIREAEIAKFPVDMAALYHSLHPDLQKAAELLPAFAKVLGKIVARELTLAVLINRYMAQYTKKDINIISRLKWWSHHYGHLIANELSEDHVLHGINKLLKKGTTGKQGVLPQTTNRFKANLSSVFEYGKNAYHLKHNPCRFIKNKPESKGRKRYLTTDEQKRFLQAARNSKWNKFYLLILMAITTGARRGELMKLRWCDIDWDESTAECINTKNGSDKKLHLNNAVMDSLREHRQVDNALIFSYSNSSTSTYDFRNEWKLALTAAKIPIVNEKGERLVFHSLRHTYCSTLANGGAELQEIAALAGHKSIQTTMRYTHLNNQRLANVQNKVFAELGESNIY